MKRTFFCLLSKSSPVTRMRASSAAFFSTHGVPCRRVLLDGVRAGRFDTDCFVPVVSVSEAAAAFLFRVDRVAVAPRVGREAIGVFREADGARAGDAAAAGDSLLKAVGMSFVSSLSSSAAAFFDLLDLFGRLAPVSSTEGVASVSSSLSAAAAAAAFFDCLTLFGRLVSVPSVDGAFFVPSSSSLSAAARFDCLALFGPLAPASSSEEQGASFDSSSAAASLDFMTSSTAWLLCRPEQHRSLASAVPPTL